MTTAPPRLAILKTAAAASLPVLAGYLFLSIAYGMLMRGIGYGPFWTTVMSILVYGGSIQMIAVSLLTSPYSPLNAFILSVIVNARHIFYGFGMLSRYAGTGWRKPALIFCLTDETFSLLCNDLNLPAGIDRNRFRLYLSLVNYTYWVAGSLLGNVAGALLTFNTKGIEFVMTALFTVVVIGQWRSTTHHLPALIGLAGTVLCLVVLGPDRFLIPAMLVIAAALLLGKNYLERDLAVANSIRKMSGRISGKISGRTRREAPDKPGGEGDQA